MSRLKLTSQSAIQTPFDSIEQRSRYALPTLFVLSVLSITHTSPVNAASEQDATYLLTSYHVPSSDEANSHYLTSQERLIQYSIIFINKTGKPAIKLPNRKLYPEVEAYNKSIASLISTGEFVTPRATIDLLNPNASHGYSQDSTEPYLSGGSALGAVLRMGLKSWWQNNEGSQLHSISAAAPESVRSGKLAGRASFDWDYTLKVSHDDVKLKFEKVF